VACNPLIGSALKARVIRSGEAWLQGAA